MWFRWWEWIEAKYAIEIVKISTINYLYIVCNIAKIVFIAMYNCQFSDVNIFQKIKPIFH